jgi:hypothetical protein
LAFITEANIVSRPKWAFSIHVNSENPKELSVLDKKRLDFISNTVKLSSRGCIF